MTAMTTGLLADCCIGVLLHYNTELERFTESAMTSPLSQQLFRALCAIAFITLFVLVQWAAPTAIRLVQPTSQAGQEAVSCTEGTVDRSVRDAGQVSAGLRL